METIATQIWRGLRSVARGLLRGSVGGMIGLALLAVSDTPGFAKSGHGRTVHATARHSPSSAHRHAAKLPGPVRASIVIDADTGNVLSEENADAPAFPASLTKLMTLYLTFQALHDGRLQLEQRLGVSAHAAAQEPTKLWLRPGESASVQDMILGIVTRSANDAAVVLAEAQAGSEAAFAARMTAEAERLGMTRTVYRNASGLPNREQRTSARDIARLAIALYRDFPKEYRYFSVREFTFRGREIAGHNHLLEWYDGADGLKTGFIRASGFNLAASAERNDRRLVGVVLGSPTWRLRDRLMAALLDRGFAGLSAPTSVAAVDPVLSADSGRAAKLRGMTRVAALLSPVQGAHAATLDAKRTAPRSGRDPQETCRIKIGPFRTNGRSRPAVHLGSLGPAVKGKPVQIVHGTGHRHLYHIVVSQLTPEAARRTCTRLRHTVSCRVLP